MVLTELEKMGCGTGLRTGAEKEKFTFEKVEMKALGRRSPGAVLEVADSGSADGICASGHCC